MGKQEVMNTRVGEMLDMISCLSVYNGGAEAKNTKKYTFDEAMDLK